MTEASDSETKFADGLAPMRGNEKVSSSLILQGVKGNRRTEMEGLTSFGSPITAFLSPRFLIPLFVSLEPSTGDLLFHMAPEQATAISISWRSLSRILKKRIRQARVRLQSPV